MWMFKLHFESESESAEVWRIKVCLGAQEIWASNICASPNTASKSECEEGHFESEEKVSEKEQNIKSLKHTFKLEKTVTD